MQYTTILATTLLLVILAGCTSPANNPATPTPDTNHGLVPTPTLPLREHAIFQQYATTNGKTIQETQTFFHNNYGIAENDIFAQLPSVPATFLQDVNTLHYGNGLGTNLIPRESYLQPEFFPTFSTTGIQTWAKAPDQFPNTVGLSSTPAEQQATLASDSNGFTTTLFIGSAWGVTYYQGMAFRYTIQPAADIHLSFDPPHILAGPTFPVFTPEWMHKITVDGTIGTDVEEGTYTITIYPADAPIEVQEQWYDAHPRYVSGNGLIGPSDGLATFTLTIPARNTTN
ncbi:MAG: hypothetical protein IPJ89_00950 [Candidatus Iainarchaeum archaeon]|uniref:Uncharacterized protein n=1 Tax=Candidatus Iainarchaeum sp. TaxID=3101447 RepID=A0A7T9I1U8_9ARCH|nr:MAG: hypothetical protein IPJ89_00950 [Candidatus Diapherotrites archaeon]